MKTFVVRIWTPARPGEAVGEELRGVADLVGTSISTTFGQAAELIAFLRRPEAMADRAGTAASDQGGDRQ